MKQSIEAVLLDHSRAVLALKDHLPTIHRIIHLMETALKSEHRIFIFGNGGSAADANHFAAELAGRFAIKDRKGLPVFSLLANSSTLTAIANDFGYEYLFSRQIEAHAEKADVIVGITTSGKSKNIINALEMGRRLECVTIALTGRSVEALSQCADVILPVDSLDTPRIQEVHTLLLHIIAEYVESRCFTSSTNFFSKTNYNPNVAISPPGSISDDLGTL